MAEDYYVSPRIKKAPTATGGVQAGAGGGDDGSGFFHDLGTLMGVGSYIPSEHEGLRSTLVGPESQYEGRGYAGAFGDLEQSRQARQQQAELARALQMQAAGIGPSLAQMQLQQGMERSQAAAQSQLASARGLSPAQAQRMALQQQAGARAGLAQQAGMLRLQEQAMKQQELANLLGQQRQQDILGSQVGAGIGGTAGGLRLRGEEAAMNQYAKEQAARAGLVGGIISGASSIGASAAMPTPAAAGGAGAGAAGAGAVAAAPLALAAHGREIEGRVKYQGDTRSNDTVPALLSPGEIVLPRSVAQDAKAPEKAKSFVEAIKSKKKPTPKDFLQAMSRLQELESRLDAMEALSDLEAEEEG